jgi:hypothetical protein
VRLALLGAAVFQRVLSSGEVVERRWLVEKAR